MSPISPRMRRARELEALRRRLAKQVTTATSADASAEQATRQQVATLMARRPTIRTAAAAVPAIVVGEPQNVIVTWETAMPVDDTYDLSIAVAPALIGKVTWSVVERKKATATIRMSPVGLSISLGQWLIATAVY